MHINSHFQLLESFTKLLARTTDIEPHETTAGLAKHSARIQCQTGLVGKQMLQLLLAKPQSTTIEKHEIGSLWAYHADGRDMLLQVSFGEVYIALNIGKHLLQPLLAVLESSLATNVSKKPASIKVWKRSRKVSSGTMAKEL